MFQWRRISCVVDVWVTPPPHLGGGYYFFPQKHTATIYTVFGFFLEDGTRGSYKTLVTLKIGQVYNLTHGTVTHKTRLKYHIRYQLIRSFEIFRQMCRYLHHHHRHQHKHNCHHYYYYCWFFLCVCVCVIT